MVRFRDDPTVQSSLKQRRREELRGYAIVDVLVSDLLEHL